MTDLTGVDLAEATAHVLGFHDDDHRWRHSGTFYIHRRPNETMPEEWRPDQGGAAAWEVLEWVRGRYEVIFADQDDDPRLVWCGISTDAHNRVCHVAGAYGPTDAIALCRAVVALGEAG